MFFILHWQSSFITVNKHCFKLIPVNISDFWHGTYFKNLVYMIFNVKAWTRLKLQLNLEFKMQIPISYISKLVQLKFALSLN